MEQKIELESSAEFHEGNNSTDPVSGLTLAEGLLFLKFRSKVVTITRVMKEILRFLEVPRSVDEVIGWVSDQKQCPRDTVYPSVHSFLDRMVRIGAVVREGEQGSSAAPFNDWKINKKFKGYTLVDQIGKKSDVLLFQCFEESAPDVSYTIKILARKKSKRGFFREAEILKLLPPHPNIRKCLHASNAEDEFPHLLLEYVEGKPISHADVNEKLPLAIKYEVAHKIFQTVGHLHSHGVLHGDIHASNFLISSAGDVKLIDLGMSHRIGDEQVGHGGIAKYMPPERMPDSRMTFSCKQGNYQSEIFQVGVCIYLLFAGHHPFGGLLLRDLAHEIKHVDPAPLTITPLGETIPETIGAIVFRSLEKDPALRQQSLTAIIHHWEEATIAPLLRSEQFFK